MTPKFYARSPSLLHGSRFPLTDSEGNKYRPVMTSRDVVIGQVAYLGKRVNNFHGEVPVWELWEITIEKDPLYSTPKLWYGMGRYVFERVR